MWNDLFVAVRGLLQRPSFAAASIATLAAGIGVTTAIFSTVNAAILRPLPYPGASDLYSIGTTFRDGRFSTGLVAPAEVFALNERAPSVTRAVIVRGAPASLSGVQGAESAAGDASVPESAQVVVYSVSGGFFELFGLPLALGPGFTRDDHIRLDLGVIVIDGFAFPKPQPPPRIVLSHRIWMERFGGDPAILDKSISLSAGTAVVAGVASADFDVPRGADAWTSMRTSRESVARDFEGFLRATPGTRRERLESELEAVAAGVAREFPAAGSGLRFTIEPLADSLVGDLKPILLLVLGAAALLLLLSSVNVTNLLLARRAVRTREFALRAALGAGRWRLIRQSLVESLVLSALGTIAGLFVAYWGVRLLLYLGASRLPGLETVPFDGRVLLFSLCALVLTGLLIGLTPALVSARVDLRRLLSEGTRSAIGGRSAQRALSFMIVAEIAVAIVLVSGAGWLVRSFANLHQTDPGFTAEGRIVFDWFPPSNLTQDVLIPELGRRSTDLVDRLLAIPGVTAVGASGVVPLRRERDAVSHIGRAGGLNGVTHRCTARMRSASPDFFRAMGVRVVAGREFARATSSGVLVNEAFVRQCLSGEDPMLSRISSGYPTANRMFFGILGVVADMQYDAVGQAPEPAFYIRNATLTGTVVVATSLADPAPLLQTIRAVVHDIDPTLPANPVTMSSIVAASLARQQLGMTLMLLFAAAALALAAIGIYGVIAYASAQRTGEVAIRMALGATPDTIFWMMMRQGRTLAIIGVAVGLAVAYAVGRLVESRLYEVQASDPLILTAAICLVAAIAAAAVALPARRASRIAVAEALRLD